ncbi:redoxin family protein [Salirhabdus sp. Marseille-P4669]|uniref:redoxin family protein n=1 Tax=Salirhabdus sp. Marseille-P4669 TaxID=2042310 RepID=UPI000C796B23|nr:redoxin family protein [Salirhabdus sp. Marseille-P4669]
MKKIIVLILLLFILTSCSKEATNSAENGSDADSSLMKEQSLEVGAIPPDISGINLIDNKEIDLSDFQGKKTIIYFWATFSEPGVGGMDKLQKLYEEQEVSILGVNIEGDVTAVHQFLDEHTISFPVIIDETNLVDTFQVGALPKTIILASNGTILASQDGASDTPLWEQSLLDTSESNDLVKQSSSNNNATESSNEKLLDTYIRNGDAEAILTLLEEHPNLDVNKDRKETRPLIVASRLGERRIVNILLEAGADPNLTSPAVHYTPLEAAFEPSSEGEEKPDYVIYEIVLSLLDYGADPNVPFVNGGSALQVAESKELHYVAEILEDHGAGSSGDTADTSVEENAPRVFDTYEKRAELAEFTKSVQIGDDEAKVRDFVGNGTKYATDERFTVYGPFPSKFIAQEGVIKLVSWGRVKLFDIPLPGDAFYEWKTDEGVGPYATYEEVIEAYEEYDPKLLYRQGEDYPAYIMVDYTDYLLVFTFYDGVIQTVFQCTPEMLEEDMVRNTSFTFDHLEDHPF